MHLVPQEKVPKAFCLSAANEPDMVDRELKDEQRRKKRRD